MSDQITAHAALGSLRDQKKVLEDLILNRVKHIEEYYGVKVDHISVGHYSPFSKKVTEVKVNISL